MNKRKIALLVAARLITGIATLLCFTPFAWQVFSTYQELGVKDYARIPSRLNPLVVSIDDEQEALEGRIARADLSDAGSLRFDVRYMEMKRKKYAIEISRCEGCEGDESYFVREANQKLDQLHSVYNNYRMQLIARHGESVVTEVESRYRWSEPELDQATKVSLLWLLIKCLLLAGLVRLPYLLLEAYCKGLRVSKELFTLDRLPMLAFIPALKPWLQFGAPVNDFKRAVKYGLFLVMTTLSSGFGGVCAQGAKSGGSKPGAKRTSGWVLTTDAREEVELEGGDAKTTTLRLMLANAKRNAFIETFTFGKASSTANTVSALVTPGLTFARKQFGSTKLTINGVAGFRWLRTESYATGTTTTQARGVIGAEVFIFSKRFQVYNPATRFEFAPGKGNKFFLFTAQMLTRAGPKKLWVGAEGNMTKQTTKNPSGYFGGVAAYDVRPGKARAEVGVFRQILPSGFGAWSTRARLIYNFSF